MSYENFSSYNASYNTVIMNHYGKDSLFIRSTKVNDDILLTVGTARYIMITLDIALA